MRKLIGQVINQRKVGSGIAESCHSRTYGWWRGVWAMTCHFLSVSSSLSAAGRSLPPTPSPRISPSLSNEAALHRLEIADSVSVALPIAITRVEGWLRGKARGGSTVIPCIR